jgi:hypothetical protein
MKVLPFFARWCLGLARPETQTSVAERDCLSRYARGRRRLAEIGVWHAVTTRLLCEHMAPDGVLLAIDPFRPGPFGFSTQRVIARRNLARIRRECVRWLRMTGVEAAAASETAALGGIEFLFIDGDHTYDGLRCDWEAWSALLVPGGFVALHDSCSSRERNIDDAGSVIFTRDVIAKDCRFEVVEVVDTLTMLRRREAVE